MKLSTLELEVLNLLETNYGISVEAISKITNKSVETIMEMMNGLIEKRFCLKAVLQLIGIKLIMKNGNGAY